MDVTMSRTWLVVWLVAALVAPVLADPQATCASACDRIARCGLIAAKQCLPPCTQAKPDPKALAAIVGATCEQLRAAWNPKWNASQPAPQPAAKWGCNSMGMYRECSHGVCSDRMAFGYGIGATEAAARTSAAVNCETHMTNMIIISNINGGAQVRASCKATSCRGPR